MYSREEFIPITDLIQLGRKQKDSRRFFAMDTAQMRIHFDLIKRKLIQHFSQQWARQNAVGWLVFITAYITFPFFDPSPIWFYLSFIAGVPSLFFGPVLSSLLLLRVAFYGWPAKQPVVLNAELDKLPRLRIRVFTRGLEEALVNRVMMQNITAMKEIGFTNFDYFVVSNVAPVSVDHVPDVTTGNIFVPSSYQTSNRVQFKARSLEYCLLGDGAFEKPEDEDYVLILDEDVQLTSNAARGVLNFVQNGYEVGDGLYSSLGDRWALQDPANHVPGIIFECHRTASYIASEFLKRAGVSFAFNAYGGFQLVKVKVARELTFDFGETRGITEDLHLFLRAFTHGYKVHHIEGVVRTQCPKEIQTMVDQRRRWAMGYLLHCSSENVAQEQRVFVAGYFWAAWIYPAIFLISACSYHSYAQPLLWCLILSDALATLCTLHIATRTEGHTHRQAAGYFWTSMYGMPLRYWYGIIYPTASAIKGFLMNQNIAEWKNRPKS